MLKKTSPPTTTTDSSSSYLLSSYPSAFVMHCEKMVPFLTSNRGGSIVNQEKLTPLFFQELLAKQNLTLNLPKTSEECLLELKRLINNTNELNTSIKHIDTQFSSIQYRSRSLIIFLILISIVSLISILGNLCLAKVLFTKRNRLTQTDRIVLCLALSELCLVIIDSPTEIYRHLAYSFNLEWLCCFHTFFESLLSSCIIFYHLLGAFDRFVYIYGHASTGMSTWARWCRRASSKTCSCILLFLPILVSLPIAICNTLHAYVIYTYSDFKICIIQYTHPTLIAILIAFCILPIVISFFLHAKLIYFIRSRHDPHYLTTATYVVPLKRNSTVDTQSTTAKKRRQKMPVLFLEQQLLQPKSIPRQSHRRMILTNGNDTAGTGTAGTMMTTSTGQTGTGNNGKATAGCSSNSSGSSRSSTATSSASTTSPIVFYKMNSQATVNANRTLLLLVLLLSFYVLCWAPYNIYTWYHVYHFVKPSTNVSSLDSIDTSLNQMKNTSDRNMMNLNNFFSSSFVSLNETQIVQQNHETKLLRVIFINYSLYLLSMISMCFSFIFYFSLNKQGRHEFSRFIRCICPWMIHFGKGHKRKKTCQHYRHHHQPQPQRYNYRRQNNNIYYRSCQNQFPPPIVALPACQRTKTIKFNNHPVMVPPLIVDRYSFNTNNTAKQLILSRKSSGMNGVGSTKRSMVTYGCHVQCCP